jgi:hypothetical protein
VTEKNPNPLWLLATIVVIGMCITGHSFYKRFTTLEEKVSEMHRLESEFQQGTIKQFSLIEQRERMRNEGSRTVRSYGGR